MSSLTPTKIQADIKKLFGLDVDSQTAEKLKDVADQLAKGEKKHYALSSSEKGPGDVEKTLGFKAENVAMYLRNRYVSDLSGTDLETVMGLSRVDLNSVGPSHDGTTIGFAQVPIKYVGSVLVNGEYAKGKFQMAIAALEGQLSQGMTRGIETFNMAGGVTTRVVDDGMTRDVLVGFNNINDSVNVYRFVKSAPGQAYLKERFEDGARYTKFLEAMPFVDGTSLHIRFKGTAGPAMGMNALTQRGKDATVAMIDHLVHDLHMVDENGVDLLTISGNMCTDKKPTVINALMGRGASVVTETVLKNDLIMERFFKNNQQFKGDPDGAAARLAEVSLKKNERGTRLAGSIAANTHVANVSAGIYIAYGQDPGQVVETSLARVYIEQTRDGVRIIGTHPAVEVGTFKGELWGTAKEMLRMTGVYGEGDEIGKTRLAFAEVCAATFTIGDANLTANQAAGTHGSTLRRG